MQLLAEPRAEGLRRHGVLVLALSSPGRPSAGSESSQAASRVQPRRKAASRRADAAADALRPSRASAPSSRHRQQLPPAWPGRAGSSTAAASSLPRRRRSLAPPRRPASGRGRPASPPSASRGRPARQASSTGRIRNCAFAGSPAGAAASSRVAASVIARGGRHRIGGARDDRSGRQHEGPEKADRSDAHDDFPASNSRDCERRTRRNHRRLTGGVRSSRTARTGISTSSALVSARPAACHHGSDRHRFAREFGQQTASGVLRERRVRRQRAPCTRRRHRPRPTPAPSRHHHTTPGPRRCFRCARRQAEAPLHLGLVAPQPSQAPVLQ